MSNDGGMASASSAVSDDGSRLLHDWLPVWISHVGDEHIALRELTHLVDARQDVHLARANARADSSALNEDISALLEHLVLLKYANLHLGGDSLWPSLNNVKLAIITINAPLDVHWTAVVVLNFESNLGQVLNLIVRDGPLILLFHRSINKLGSAALRVNHLDLLGAHRPGDDGRLALFERWLEDVELVRVDSASNNGLAEAPSASHKDNVTIAALGVQREGNTSRGRLAANHPLAGGAKLHLIVLEAAVVAIGDGAVGEKGCEHEVHMVTDILVAAHVQVRLLLASEGSIRQIFSCGRRSDSPSEVVVASSDALPLGTQIRLEFLLERSVHDLLTDGSSNHHELVDVLIDGLVLELVVDEVVDATLRKELLVRMGSSAETTWHWHARTCKVGDHLAKRSALAANFFDVVVVELLERDVHAKVLLATASLARCYRRTHSNSLGVGASADGTGLTGGSASKHPSSCNSGAADSKACQAWRLGLRLRRRRSCGSASEWRSPLWRIARSNDVGDLGSRISEVGSTNASGKHGRLAALGHLADDWHLEV